LHCIALKERRSIGAMQGNNQRKMIEPLNLALGQELARGIEGVA
jgi:hypothetical protein